MSIEEVRRYRNAKPFRPFVLHLGDGRTFYVPHALRIAIAPWGKVAVSDGVAADFVKPEDISEIRLAETTAP